MNNNAPFRLLLLEDSESDAELVKVALARQAPGEFAVTWVYRLADALAQVRTERFDVIVSDLGLPDSTGLATAQAIAACAATLPLVVLTGAQDEDLGRAAIQHGAQDYLVKGDASGRMVARTLRYAIERKRLEIGLRVANESLERVVAERTAELELAVKKLRESEARFRGLTELASDWYWEQDENFRFTWLSRELLEMTGSANAVRIGKTRWELPTEDVTEEQWAEHRRRLEAHLPFRDFEVRRVDRDGRPRYVSVSGFPVFDENKRFCGYRGVGHDVTGRKLAELALERQKDLYSVLSQTNKVIVRGAGRDVLFQTVCRVAVEHGHFRFAWIGMIQKDDPWLTPAAKYGEDAGYMDRLHAVMSDRSLPRRGLSWRALLSGVHTVSNDFLSDTETAPWHETARSSGVGAFAAFPIHQGGAAVGVINVYAGEPGFFSDDLLATLDEMAADVSFGLDNLERAADRRQVVAALGESEMRYRHLFESNPHPMWVYDADTLRFLTVNDAAVAQYGWSREEFLGMTLADIRPAEDVPRLRDRLSRAGAEQMRSAGVWKHRRKDGTLIDVEISSHVVDLAGRRGWLVLAHDITERERAEEQRRAAEEQFRSLVEQSIAGTYILQGGKIVYVNPRFAEILGYESSDELIGREALTLVAEKDRKTVEEHIRQRLSGQSQGINFAAAFLKKDGSTVDIGIHGARASYRGKPAIIGMMQDISEKKRAEEQIQRHVMQLENAFMSTVGVATTLSEMRDPYTAGHERRVGWLAVAIGAELGLDPRRIEGLRVAGYLHDIGKITIPSEILSKPGKLSPIEFKLIQAHPQASYDVLKDVEFPWPVAQTVLHHHERMDGSGYPQGLKGEAILFEARIVAVADVIEAMSSHRPYRPGLGIDKALAEIERGRGTVYDADVADACLRLFREKRYALLI